jgi:fructose-1,6-bisphosphatase/inositol monophosphatase family enzyme
MAGHGVAGAPSRLHTNVASGSSDASWNVAVPVVDTAGGSAVTIVSGGCVPPLDR